MPMSDTVSDFVGRVSTGPQAVLSSEFKSKGDFFLGGFFPTVLGPCGPKLCQS